MVPQSFQDEAHARWSTPREVQLSILKSERVLGTLYATPKVTRHTCLTWGKQRGSQQHFIWATSPSNARKWKVKVKSLSRVWLLATPWTADYQTPLSMGFSRQEYWSGVPLPSPCYSLEWRNQVTKVYVSECVCVSMCMFYGSANFTEVLSPS